MQAPTSILLFAAGLGTRMAPLTNTRPKPLVEIAGRALLDHALQYCDGLRVVVNAHYLSEQIANHIKGQNIALSDETDQLLETGGGLKRALPLLEGNPVYTMNTDAVWRGENPVKTLETTPRPTQAKAQLLLIPRDRAIGHTGHGDFDMNVEGRLARGTQYVYTGLQIIRTDGLAAITDVAFSMWALWTDMLERGEMFGAVYGGQWCDVGRPDSIHLAENMLEGHADV